MFKLPVVYSKLAHCVAVRRFDDGKFYLLNSAIHRKPRKTAANPGQLKPKPNDNWPHWGDEQLSEERLRLLLSQVLASGPTPDVSYVFAISDVPSPAELDQMDGSLLCKNLSARLYRQICNLLDWPVKP